MAYPQSLAVIEMEKIVVVLIFFMFSCENREVSWSESIKSKIIDDATIKYSAITTGNSRDGYLYESYYKDSVLLFELAYSVEHDRYEINRQYSADKKFELVQELCPNKTVAFEGIKYGDNFYGSSIWWYCNGQKQMEGLRFNNENIGIWNYWDDKGKLIKTKDYGHENLIDSLKMIKYYR
ncbi:toxin-antitoxin system YwqK family antitoxin [Catalinimonas niigatensis]|uniref:hypothetical protein n=1 Tax=Catalinimonas niigatensis TaxID=1397264 RepID=UPI002666C14D|nr:hypothetical protein [Catalinimonas niigatensis]WPP50688.1 hypothetical protein PZB72_28915 [Catalinimonas niigatensis]